MSGSFFSGLGSGGAMPQQFLGDMGVFMPEGVLNTPYNPGASGGMPMSGGLPAGNEMGMDRILAALQGLGGGGGMGGQQQQRPMAGGLPIASMPGRAMQPVMPGQSLPWK